MEGAWCLWLRQEIPGELVAHEDKAAGHEDDIGRERLMIERLRATPEGHGDQDAATPDVSQPACVDL